MVSWYLSEVVMLVKDAVVLRIKGLCRERNISLNELAMLSGVTPSTVYSVCNPKRRQVGIATVKKLCDGFNISLSAFFDSDVFDGLSQEIE